MLDEWKLSVVVPMFKGKGDLIKCGSYRGVKLMEMVLDSRMGALVNLDNMQFGFKPGRGTMDALFILRRMYEEYLDKKKKLYKCFVNLEKVFDKSLKKGDGMGNEKERYTRKYGKGDDEPVSRSKNNSQSGNKVIGRISGES